MNPQVYVSPDQLIKDRADFARKGVARGRPVVVLCASNGIVLATENPFQSLRKTSEIYDRIAFAAVGKYNEFESLRVAGIRYADLRGYSYSRADVRAHGLANAYAQTIGSVFTTEAKPLEVDVVLAELGPVPGQDRIYRVSFDGSIAEEPGYVAMGAGSESITTSLADQWRPDLRLDEAVSMAIRTATARDTSPSHIEAAVLERTGRRRTFRRLTLGEVAAALE